MSKTEILNVKKTDLLGALLYGHLVNIGIGAMVFALCHWMLKYSPSKSVAITVVATAAVSVVVAVLGTRKISTPLAAMHNELNLLHQKIDSAGNELNETTQNTEALFDNLPSGILVFDKDAELTNHNSKAFELLGLLPKESEDDNLMEQVIIGDTTTVINSLQRFHLDGTRDMVDVFKWLKQARLQKIQEVKRWRMAVDNSGDNTVACDIIARYNRDESHQYELVIVLVDRTEEYNRQEKQMEFIALAAHELRGPVTVMRGLIDILQQEVSPTLDQEYVTLINRMGISTRQLAGYVDNILGVSQIDRESFTVEASEGKWSDIVAQSTADLSARAQAHLRKLDIEIDKNLPTVAVDGTSILHVINNLVDNAIKYSPEGGTVTVRASLKDDMVETEIRDDGIGIPASVVTNLFTKFYRSHRSKQVISGTGLGLYLSKAIVEAHGGNIWVRSTEGVGTTFGFTVPTYASVAKKGSQNSNHNDITRTSHGWIKNHALYRR